MKKTMLAMMATMVILCGCDKTPGDGKESALPAPSADAKASKPWTTTTESVSEKAIAPVAKNSDEKKNELLQKFVKEYPKTTENLSKINELSKRQKEIEEKIKELKVKEENYEKMKASNESIKIGSEILKLRGEQIDNDAKLKILSSECKMEMIDSKSRK